MSLQWGKNTEEKDIDEKWRAISVVKESISVR